MEYRLLPTCLMPIQRYLRNRIRHSLIPELKARYNPKLEESVKNMAEIMRVEDDYMKIVTARSCRNGA